MKKRREGNIKAVEKCFEQKGTSGTRLEEEKRLNRAERRGED